MVDVDGSSQFSADLQPKSIGLVSWSGGGLLTQPQKPYQLATNRNMKPAGRRTTITVYIYSESATDTILPAERCQCH